MLVPEAELEGVAFLPPANFCFMDFSIGWAVQERRQTALSFTPLLQRVTRVSQLRNPGLWRDLFGAMTSTGPA